MDRLAEIRKFIESDHKENLIIEPPQRHDTVKEKLIEALDTYKPEVIIKAGLGRGELLAEIANNTASYITVVEPSYSLIADFLKEYAGNGKIKKIKFLNGGFHQFPLDYYAADFLLCIDYLDFFDSSISLNEFNRVLKFGGIFFLSSVILNDNDVDGIYDDFFRLIFPLHNDFYISDDLNTFLDLKEFDSVTNHICDFTINFNKKINFFHNIFGADIKEKALDYIESNKNEFKKLMGMNDEYKANESYYIGTFKRRKQ